MHPANKTLMKAAMGDEADRNKERLTLALEAAGLDLWENDLVSGQVTHKARKTFLELGFTEDEIVSGVQDLYGLFHPEDLDKVQQAVADHVSGATPQYRTEFRLRAKSGEWVWFANYGRIMDRSSATPGQRLIGVTFNIDDRKRQEDEMAQINQQLVEQNKLLQQLNTALESLAATDSMTGLANRRTLMKTGANECKRAARFGHPLSLLLVDIDLFKTVNDTWGHLAGDCVICAVAQACAAHQRSGVDVVARFGGDEFVIVLPETEASSALHLAQLLRDEVAALAVPEHLSAGSISVTVSIGVASWHRGAGLGFDDLLHQADQALYRAKETGRNAVCCADLPHGGTSAAAAPAGL